MILIIITLSYQSLIPDSMKNGGDPDPKAVIPDSCQGCDS